MTHEKQVTVTKVDVNPDSFELVLDAAEETGLQWRKRYHGILFLSMDAQSLDLLEQVPRSSESGPRLQLKRKAYLDPGKLLRMRFTEQRI